jgi:predicted DNA-binding transcriptional regulator YafY
MMSLTERESALFYFLNQERVVTLDEIMQEFPASSRHAAIVRMKYLSSKIAQHGWIITNEGGVGRGKKAAYSMKRQFNPGEGHADEKT